MQPVVLRVMYVLCRWLFFWFPPSDWILKQHEYSQQVSYDLLSGRKVMSDFWAAKLGKEIGTCLLYYLLSSWLSIIWATDNHKVIETLKCIWLFIFAHGWISDVLELSCISNIFRLQMRIAIITGIVYYCSGHIGQRSDM